MQVEEDATEEDRRKKYYQSLAVQPFSWSFSAEPQHSGNDSEKPPVNGMEPEPPEMKAVTTLHMMDAVRCLAEISTPHTSGQHHI